MVEPATLFLVRHGEIDRPPVPSFDDAVLTEAGLEQVHTVALRWSLGIPDIIYCSPLPRSVETASIFAAVFRRPIRTVHGLEEWAATEEDVPQEEYHELERRCWADFDFENEHGESLRHATERIHRHLMEIGAAHTGRSAMVSGHSILFALFLGKVRGERASETSKNRIGFAHWAVVEQRDSWRIVRDFGP